MAPEILKGEQHTRMIDLWSLGVVAFEMLSGRMPFTGETPEEVFNNIQNRNIKVWPTVGEDEDDITQTTLDFLN